MNMHDKFGIDIIPVKFWKEVDCKKKKTHGKVSNSFNFQRNLHFLLKLNVKLHVYSFKKGHVLVYSYTSVVYDMFCKLNELMTVSLEICYICM